MDNAPHPTPQPTQPPDGSPLLSGRSTSDPRGAIDVSAAVLSGIGTVKDFVDGAAKGSGSAGFNDFVKSPEFRRAARSVSVATAIAEGADDLAYGDDWRKVAVRTGLREAGSFVGGRAGELACVAVAIEDPLIGAFTCAGLVAGGSQGGHDGAEALGDLFMGPSGSELHRRAEEAAAREQWIGDHPDIIPTNSVELNLARHGQSREPIPGDLWGATAPSAEEIAHSYLVHSPYAIHEPAPVNDVREVPTYEAPTPTYEAPAPVRDVPPYEAPAPTYEVPAPTYEVPPPANDVRDVPPYEAPTPSYEAPTDGSSDYGGNAFME
jgi:hypothetical protein